MRDTVVLAGEWKCGPKQVVQMSIHLGQPSRKSSMWKFEIESVGGWVYIYTRRELVCWLLSKHFQNIWLEWLRHAVSGSTTSMRLTMMKKIVVDSSTVTIARRSTLVVSISLALFARGFPRPCFCPFGVVQ